MKKFNLIITGCILFYLAAFFAAGIYFKLQNQKAGSEYLVEVNRIMYDFKEGGGFSQRSLFETEYISEISFLKQEDLEDQQKNQQFFETKNGLKMHIEPLIVEDKVLGLIRFDYIDKTDQVKMIRIVEGLIILSGIFMLAVLFYIRNRLLKPFIVLSNMPYELAKGRLGTEIEENKNRFFGKFVWGISMLKDNLKASQVKTLKLEKEKKLLLLSISHDIKTPLNSIKLYAKALEEGIYDTKEKQTKAVRHIQKLSDEIEGFVKEIIKSSSEDIVPIEVENSEFYLKDLVDQIREYYTPKCRLVMTELVIGSYENKLLKGSRDSAFEVIENIMENAFKYGDGRQIDISFYEEEYCQLVRIKNTGQKVRTEEMPHLFDSFYRGSNVGSCDGNGLGLYICREIMRKMEGGIFALEEEDGMSFHLVFRM
ncbi:MAG: HAMP domain-containing histidine kinase [Lachnospiraceae bacterium]|nr:HAMP domain-containing histidine kinase [Lachnospiraceae bacterium]